MQVPINITDIDEEDGTHSVAKMYQRNQRNQSFCCRPFACMSLKFILSLLSPYKVF